MIASDIVGIVFACLLAIIIITLCIDYVIMRVKEQKDEKTDITADRARANVAVSKYFKDCDRLRVTRKLYYKILKRIERVSKQGACELNMYLKNFKNIERQFLAELLEHQKFGVYYVTPEKRIVVYWNGFWEAYVNVEGMYASTN